MMIYGICCSIIGIWDPKSPGQPQAKLAGFKKLDAYFCFALDRSFKFENDYKYNIILLYYSINKFLVKNYLKIISMPKGFEFISAMSKCSLYPKSEVLWYLHSVGNLF